MYKIMSVCVLLASFLASDAYAIRYDITADIGQIRYHDVDNTMASSWRGDMWFSLSNPNQQPNCKKYSGKYAISVSKGNETAISMILAAKMSSSKVIVTIDDEVKRAGSVYCQLQYITIK
ncbi:hypothetical protein AN944_00285 [Shewanella sp. P1-14-1]|uniref:hypothetical protein n=1 Tax=Shewanella sp. P1-14-1 TaxID=1723761 RepID=UPI0006D66231|nr:hypothetical protein [Shewanella sp. P1-14-1]KPZ73137.1 hypothetical protein AN944_00285 [Shewanella sp. P1-14-1]